MQTAEKFKRKSTEHLQSMTEGSVLMENVYMSGDLEIMWRALKHSEAIKYAGIEATTKLYQPRVYIVIIKFKIYSTCRQ